MLPSFFLFNVNSRVLSVILELKFKRVCYKVVFLCVVFASSIMLFYFPLICTADMALQTRASVGSDSISHHHTCTHSHPFTISVCVDAPAGSVGQRGSPALQGRVIFL